MRFAQRRHLVIGLLISALSASVLVVHVRYYAMIVTALITAAIWGWLALALREYRQGNR